MKFRIKEVNYDRFTVEKRYFGFLWLNINWVNNYHPEYFYELEEAEEYIKVLCRRAQSRKVKPKVIKEVTCNEN